MLIPFQRKLEVLARVCQSGPGSQSETADTRARGALIALEGSDDALLWAVGMVVEKGLMAFDDMEVKFWCGKETGKKADSSSESQEPALKKPFAQQYFQTVMDWQQKSLEIMTFTNNGPKRSPEPDSDEKVPEKTPVAVVKDGYSLTVTNRFAVDTPITDDYKPADHWQWMAGLWRGTACPDLIVYVMPTAEDEANQQGSVDVQKQMGLIIVRAASDYSITDAVERRLMFEIGEWLQEASFRAERPANWRRNEDSRLK